MRYENTMRYACQCPIQQKPVQPLDWSDSQESRAREKTRYNDRIIQVENGTFTPLIFGTNGAMDYECENVQLRDLTNTLLQWIGYGHV